MKADYGDNEFTNIHDIEEQELLLNDQIKELQTKLELQKKELIESYDRKYEKLSQELELRLKVEIHEIEERKN